MESMNGSQIPNSSPVPSHSIVGKSLHCAIQTGTLFQQTGLQGKGVNVVPLQNQILGHSAAAPVSALIGHQYVYCVQPQQVVYLIHPAQAHSNASLLTIGGLSTGQKQQEVQLKQNTGGSTSHSLNVTESQHSRGPEQAQAPPNVPLPASAELSAGQKQQEVQLKQNIGSSISHPPLGVTESQHANSPPKQVQLPALASNQISSLAIAIAGGSCSTLPKINGKNLVAATSSLSSGQSTRSDVIINGSQCQNTKTASQSVIVTNPTRSPPSSSSSGNAASSVPKSQQSASSECSSVPASEKSLSDVYTLKHITKISRKDLINISRSTRAQNIAYPGIHFTYPSSSSTHTPVQTVQEQSKTQVHKAVAIVSPLSKQCADAEEKKQTSEPFKVQSIQAPSGEKVQRSSCSAIVPPVSQQCAAVEGKKLNSELFNVPTVQGPSEEKTVKILPESGCSAVVPPVSQQCTDGEKKKQTSEPFMVQSVQGPFGEKAVKILTESTRQNSDRAKCSEIDEGNKYSPTSKKGRNEEPTQSQRRSSNVQPNENCGQLGALDGPVQVVTQIPLKYSLGMLKELVADLEAKNMKQSNSHHDPDLVKTLLDRYWGGSLHNYQAARAKGHFNTILQEASTVTDEWFFDCMETDDLLQLNDRFYILNGDCGMSKDTIESSSADIGEEIGRLNMEPVEKSSTSETFTPLPTECKKNGGVDRHIDNEIMKCASLENPHLSPPPEATDRIPDRNNADNSQVGDILKTRNELDVTFLKSPGSPDDFPVKLTVLSSEDIERFFNCAEDGQMTSCKEPVTPTLSSEGHLDSQCSKIKLKVLSPEEAKAISKLFEDRIEPSCKSPDTLTSCASDLVEVGFASVCLQERCVDQEHIKAKTVDEETKTSSDSNVAPRISPSAKSIEVVARRYTAKTKKKTGDNGKKPLFKKALSSYMRENTRGVSKKNGKKKISSCETRAPEQPHKGQVVCPKSKEECVPAATHTTGKRKLLEHGDQIVDDPEQLHGFERPTVPQDDTILKPDVKRKRYESPIKTPHRTSKQKLHKENLQVSGSETPAKSLDCHHLQYTPSHKPYLYSQVETAKEKVIKNWATAFVPAKGMNNK